MAYYPKIKLSPLREIGWSLWDPIGLGLPGEGWPKSCADEYDGYLLHASDMLNAGKSRQDVSRYLVQIASEHMGLSQVDERAAIATVNAIAQYLETLPDGPTKVG